VLAAKAESAIVLIVELLVVAVLIGVLDTTTGCFTGMFFDLPAAAAVNGVLIVDLTGLGTVGTTLLFVVLDELLLFLFTVFIKCDSLSTNAAIFFICRVLLLNTCDRLLIITRKHCISLTCGLLEFKQNLHTKTRQYCL
jgi:hypothetical protein